MIRRAVASSAKQFAAYWKRLGNDYAVVAKDTAKTAAEMPVRTGLIGCCVALMYCAVKTNPDERRFWDLLTESRIKLMLVGSLTQNPISLHAIHALTDDYNKDLIRRINLIFCSLLWQDDHSRDCSLFEARCQSLRPKWRNIFRRVVDVGLFGHWIYVEKAMKDYDVNPDEFKILPKS